MQDGRAHRAGASIPQGERSGDSERLNDTFGVPAAVPPCPLAPSPSLQERMFMVLSAIWLGGR